MAKYMSEVLLNRGDNLVLLFPEPSDASIPIGDQGAVGVPYARAFFFKVALAGELKHHYDLYDVLNPETGLNFNYLGDAGPGAGDDILRVEEDDWWIYHFGYSPLQDTLRVYPKIEGRYNMTGFQYPTPDRPDPTLGDPYGFVKGAEIYNWFDPSVKTESVSFRNDKSGQMWEFGLYNEHPDLRIDPAMWLYGKAYRVDPVVEKENMEKMLVGYPQQFRRRIVTVDGIRDWREEAYIPTEWKNVGNEMYVTWEEVTGVIRPERATPIVRGR